MHALESLGFRPIPAPNMRWENGGRPTPASLAEDITWCCERDDISAIICSTGGLRSAELLPYLNYDALRSARKPFCGFSDITALILGIYARSGIVTFHGPTLLPSMGDADGIDTYTAAQLRACWSPQSSRVLRPPITSSSDSPIWEVEDHRPRRRELAGSWRAVTPGASQGHLVGGHLGTIGELIGTPYLPATAGAIVLLETNEISTATICRQLTLLSEARFFDGVAGLIFGRTLGVDVPSLLDDRLKGLGRDHAMPVLADVDVGHTVPIMTIPIGVTATLDSTRAFLRLDESPVE